MLTHRGVSPWRVDAGEAVSFPVLKRRASADNCGPRIRKGRDLRAAQGAACGKDLATNS
jgi:hypothetical protein